MGFLYSLDTAIFHFINQTLSTPLGDLIWPYITDYAQLLPVKIAFVLVWLLLIVRGGRIGRTAALLLIPTIALADQLSSSVIKEIVSRPRPCHTVDGVQVIHAIHLLVDCGPGKSFPSSHAVNNFAAATLFSLLYRKWSWAFFAWASCIALSRVAVGVHYPSDVLGGAIIGIVVASVVYWAWQNVESRLFPRTHGADLGRKDTA